MITHDSSHDLAGMGVKLDTSIESRIPIGDPVQITCRDKKYISIFRGVIAFKCLLIDIPVEGGKKVLLDYNASLTARFLEEGTVYGFKTAVVRLHSKSDLMVLEYPDSIRRFELRKSKRLNVIIPSVVTTGWETESSTGKIWQTETLPGAIMDISEIGALIAVSISKFVDVGHKVTISTTLPDGTRITSLEAEIKNVRSSTNKLFLGLYFHNRDDDSVKTILNFYRECMGYKDSAELGS